MSHALEPDPESGHRRRRRVLVVDDHSDVRAAIRDTLEGEGYAVDEAADGEEALDLLQLGAFDAAVVDVRLPGIDGFALLEEAARRGVACPTVVMSVLSDAESARRAEALGAVSFHGKPFALERLIDDVRIATGGAADAGPA